MEERAATISAESSQDGRLLGALELGVAPADVEVEELGAGRYRVVVIRAPGAIEVDLSDDGMIARLKRLGPAFGDHPHPSDEDVLAALEKAGVCFGVVREEIEKAVARVAATGEEVRDLIVARGREPRRGRDAGIEFAKDIGGITSGTMTSEGRVDYHERNMVQPAVAGELIGTWRPAGEGEPGRRVDGREIPALPGEDLEYRGDETVSTQELADGSIELKAAIDGVVKVHSDDVLSIIHQMEIHGDVDLGTGNVDSGGSILIFGCVSGGFRVVARHDVTVRETVDNALVRAGGTIEVRRGIIGGEHGGVQAGKHVLASFAQNACIHCGGDVIIANSDTNSEIYCEGRILAKSGRGRLRGGVYRAQRGLVAKELGSKLGAPTQVIVGVAIPEAKEIDARLAPVTNEKTAKFLKNLDRDLPGAEDLPVVEVLEKVHHGVVINICGVSLRIESDRGRARFVLDREAGEILVEELESVS